MTLFLLIRHATNDWVKTGKLAGWTPGIHLNEHGYAQAAALGERLAKTRLHAIYASPLERTQETAQAVAAHHKKLTIKLLEDIGEVRYGDWEGQELSRLRKFNLWVHVQHHPTGVHFPGGESMRAAQARAVECIERLYLHHPGQTVAVVSHSDILKMITAHYLGMHLDLFQRIDISPASITTLRLDSGRPMLHNLNDTSHNPVEKKDDQSKGSG